MADQRLSGDGAKGEAAERQGSRTPGAGAAGERGAHKLGPPPLSTGPISPAAICVCGYSLSAHLAPHPHELDVLLCPGFLAASLPIGSPIFPPRPFGSHPTFDNGPGYGDGDSFSGSHPCPPASTIGSHPAAEASTPTDAPSSMSAAASAGRSASASRSAGSSTPGTPTLTHPLLDGTPLAAERARQSAPATRATHNSGEGEPTVTSAYAGAGTEVFPCDPRDPRPIWEQAIEGPASLADSFTESGGIDNLPIESAATSLWLVYSNEHRAFWGPGHHGYTTDTDRAGRYSQAAAAAICERANIVPRDPPNEVMVLAPRPIRTGY